MDQNIIIPYFEHMKKLHPSLYQIFDGFRYMSSYDVSKR
jgi:hypothetical protein